MRSTCFGRRLRLWAEDNRSRAAITRRNMKVECQKCFTDVIPMADGRCPACGELLGSGERAVLTKVTVFERGACGNVCMKCGTPTRERVRVRRKARNTNYQPNQSSSFDNHPLAVLINFVAGKYHQTVVVTVPLCANCKKDGIDEPKHIDFERRSMTFVGHRTWKDDLERERQTKPGA